MATVTGCQCSRCLRQAAHSAEESLKDVTQILTPASVPAASWLQR